MADAAPIISLAIALVLPHLLAHDPAKAPVLGPDPSAVVAAVEAVPYRIGNWVGVDIPMPEAAVRLLRPNAMLSRRYRDIESGATIELVLVHCGDARDMLGHYPPVCYPNAGWVALEQSASGARRARGVPMDLNIGSNVVHAQMYEFTRMETWTSEAHIRVFNLFVLPDGTVTNNIDNVRQQSSWLGASIVGVGQVQLLTDGRMPSEEAIAAANTILGGIEGLFRALGVMDHE